MCECFYLHGQTGDHALLAPLSTCTVLPSSRTVKPRPHWFLRVCLRLVFAFLHGVLFSSKPGTAVCALVILQQSPVVGLVSYGAVISRRSVVGLRSNKRNKIESRPESMSTVSERGHFCEQHIPRARE